MTDEDLLHQRADPEFGSGVIGVCDVCGRRQAVIVLQKERFQLCVIDFLNKTWSTSGNKPGAPLPLYRSERIWFPTRAEASGTAPAIVLSPTKLVRRPIVLVAPDVYGLTTSVLDGAIRLAREGFEVLLPDLARTSGVGPTTHLSLRFGARRKGGVPSGAPRVEHLVALYRDGLAFLRTRELADAAKVALFGSSYGGSLAALVAAQEPSIAAVALAYPHPIQPPELLKVIRAPTFVVWGSADAAARAFVAQAATMMADRPGTFTTFEVPGGRHHFLARDLPAYQLAGAEAAWGQVLAFFKRQLLPPVVKPPAPVVAKAPPVLPGASARSIAPSVASPSTPAAGAVGAT